jgi:hypothetical protein
MPDPLPATSSTRISNPRYSNYMASYELPFRVTLIVKLAIQVKFENQALPASSSSSPPGLRSAAAGAAPVEARWWAAGPATQPPTRAK